MSKGLDAWHAAVKAKSADAVMPLLADDAVFESPIVHKPQVGKALTGMYLTGALHVLNNDSFTYLNEWTGKDSAVLEFQTVIDGITINGVDIISWNAEGLISHFKVMVRPLKAINLVHQKMGAMLETLKAS